MRNVAKKVIEANKKGIEKEERDFNATVIELNGEYELKFQELDFAYENIKTEELRQKYNQTLQSQSEVKSHAEYIKQITDEIESEIKTKQIEKRYSKVGNYDPELIKTISDGISKGEKLVLRKSSKWYIRFMRKTYLEEKNEFLAAVKFHGHFCLDVE